MSTSPAQNKRRFSDQTRIINIKNSSNLDQLGNSKRRQTITGDFRHRISSTTGISAAATVLHTPTKHKIDLGSTSASSYYFSGIQETPLATAEFLGKKAETNSRNAKNHEEHCFDGNASVQNEGDSFDILNKSVLSDTTDLTASNFVRVATSRMQVVSINKSESAQQADSVKRSDLEFQSPGNKGISVNAYPVKAAISPHSLRNFTQTLKESRLHSSTNETLFAKGLLDENPYTSPMSKPIDRNASSSDLDVSLASLDDLFNGLVHPVRAESPESSLLASPGTKKHTFAPGEASQPPNPITNVELNSSFLSPAMSPIRRTPSKPTPTKLSPSPRRAVNLNAVDSPARNTRSASRNTSSDKCPQASGIFDTDGDIQLRSPLPAMSTLNPILALNKYPEESHDIPSSTASLNLAYDTDQEAMLSKSWELESEDSHALLADGSKDSGPKEKLHGARNIALQRVKNECASVPRSILNSNMKKQSASEFLRKKTVAFGSPEAAEYHVGSPSVSLTPMPSIRAKALFSIPSAFSEMDLNPSVSVETLDQLSNNEESGTDEIEVDVNQLLENANKLIVTQSEQHESEAKGTIRPLLHAPSSANHTIRNQSLSLPNQDVSIEPPPADPMVLDDTSSIIRNDSVDEARTVELESTIASLLKTTCMGQESTPRSVNSFEGVPSEKIASTEDFLDQQHTDVAHDQLHAQDSTFSVEFIKLPSFDVCIDEDNTVELEGDLSAILAMASQESDGYDSLPALKLAERFQKNSSSLAPTTLRLSFGHNVRSQHFDDMPQSPPDYGHNYSPASTLRRRRRSDSSAGRFCLARTGRMSIASEGSALDLSFSDCVVQIDPSEADSHLANNDAADFGERNTISSKVIEQIIRLSESTYETKLDSGFHLCVQSLCTKSGVQYSQVSDSILSFALAVCAEVEEKAQIKMDDEASFDDLIDSMNTEKVQFQRWLKKAANQNEIEVIAAVSHEIIHHEWSGWEKVVLDSLMAAIAQIGTELAPESSRLDDCITALYDLKDLLSISAGKAARNARRRSMARHKSNTMHLTDEIKNLEIELIELDEQVSQSSCRLREVENSKTVIQRYILAQTTLPSTRRAAEHSRRKFLSVKGLSRVTPCFASHSNLTLAHIGSHASSSLTTSFTFLPGSSIQCKSLGENSHIRSSAMREKLSIQAVAFMKSRCSLLLIAHSDMEIWGVDEMRSLVRHLEWTRGRIECIAQELTLLQRRFNFSIEKIQDCEFLIRVSFYGASKDSLLVTAFELDASYPYGPLNVSLEPGHSHINLGHLQKHLMKNAKPGFGYLSRACDLIAALMQSVS